jgi:predicted nucleic acid-binding protein
MRRFVDTNILIYAISWDPGIAAKKARADAILDDDHCALSVQVLQEFYVQATRATRPHTVPHDEAVRMVEAWMRFPVQAMTPAVLLHALGLCGRYRFSYWDSAIVAAAVALDCDELLTEDLQHGQTVEGVRIVNPFL